MVQITNLDNAAYNSKSSFWVAAAIGAAATIGSAIAQGVAAKKAKKDARVEVDRQNQFNADEATKNRLWQEEMYKKYTSPEAQMKQAQAAGINPYAVAPNVMGASVGTGAQATGSNAAAEVASADMRQGDVWQQVISQSLPQAINLYNAALQAQSTKEDVKTKQLNNDKLRIELENWNRPMKAADLAGFLGYDENSPWYNDFIRDYGKEPSFADTYFEAILKAPARDLNRRNGIGAETAVSPEVAFLNWLNNNYGFADSRGTAIRNVSPYLDKDGKPTGRWINHGMFDYVDTPDGGMERQRLSKIAFDMLNGRWSRDIDQQDFERMRAHYGRKLLRHGINPDAASSGMGETLLRYAIQNDDTGGIEHLSRTLGSLIGNASDFVANGGDFVSNLFRYASKGASSKVKKYNSQFK